VASSLSCCLPHTVQSAACVSLSAAASGINHFPAGSGVLSSGLRSVDEAIRRRLHLVPFTITIPIGERDPSLSEKLRAEFPGILAWCIQGCLDWQQYGLNPPAIVRNATADYLAGEDAIGRWLADDCISDGACWTLGAALFSDYKAWCERTGERPMSQKGLTQALEGRGFVQKRTNAARGFVGIALRVDVTRVTDSPVISVSRARTPHIGVGVTSVTERQVRTGNQ
jgi:phage/plasmid-associated DNA primase